MNVLDIAKKLQAILRQIPASAEDCEKVGEYISQLETCRVDLCVSGEFSSGKSSLLNALINYPLLPVADRPLTSIRIGIQHSDLPYFICWVNDDFSDDSKREICRYLAGIEVEQVGRSTRIQDRIVWNVDGHSLKYQPIDKVCLKDLLNRVEASQNSKRGRSKSVEDHEEFLIKRILRVIVGFLRRSEYREFPVNSEMIEKMEIGLPLPDGLKNACLWDIPGEGSVCTYQSNTKWATQTSQLVLHVLDAEHIGSKLTENMLAEVEQNGATNVFVLNKRDAVDDASLRDEISLLHKKYEINPIPVSALCENCSYLLTHDLCKVEDILTHRKVNLAPIISSENWDHGNVENNRLTIANYLHSISNIQALVEDVSSAIASNRTRIELFCRDKILAIVESCLHKVKGHIDRMENPPQKELLISEIDSMRKLCRDVEEFEKEENRKLGSDFAARIDSVLKGLLERLDKMMSDALSVSFGRFENKLKATVASTLVLPISGEIRNCIDRYVTQRQNAYLEFISKHRLAVSQATSDLESCCIEDLRKRIQEDTCSIVGSILKDTSQKPWLSFLRPDALAEYRREKHQECMQQWRVRMAQKFSKASEDAVATCRQIVWGKMMPLLNLMHEKKKDLQSREFALSNLKEALSNNSEYRCLRNVQNEFSILLEAINQQGVKS